MRERKCPVCANTSHLCSTREAQAVYDVRRWRGQTGLMEFDSTDLVCAWCKSVRVDGEWTRMQSVDSRAEELSRQSSKDRSEIRDSLRDGQTRA